MTRYRPSIGTLLAAAILATGCRAIPETTRSVQSVQSMTSVPTDVSQVRAPVPAARQPRTVGKGRAVTSSSPLRSAAAQSTSPPASYNGFSLVVRTSAGNIEAPIAALSVELETDGTAAPIDPPHDTAQQWRTAAWIEQSAYPTAAATGGPSYIYGHACHHHVCSFTHLRNATTGDAVTVDTPASLLTYRICATGRSAKNGNLQVPTCGAEPVDLVLVTCEYEQGDQSTHNLVVAAQLVSSRNR